MIILMIRMTSDHENNVDPFADNDDNVFEHESANGDNELSTENVPLQNFEAARLTLIQLYHHCASLIDHHIWKKNVCH